MACPRELGEMKELTGRDDAVLYLSDEGGVWQDSVDVNRLLLRAGLPGLESMGGTPDLDAIGDLCPKDAVDLIVIGGGSKNDPLEYGICEVCGGLWLELGLDEDVDADAIDEATLDFFRDFGRTSTQATRTART